MRYKYIKALYDFGRSRITKRQKEYQKHEERF